MPRPRSTARHALVAVALLAPATASFADASCHGGTCSCWSEDLRPAPVVLRYVANAIGNVVFGQPVNLAEVWRENQAKSAPRASPRPVYSISAVKAIGPGTVPRKAEFHEGPLNVPTSFALLENKLRVNANASVAQVAPDRFALGWGAGAEFEAAPPVTLLARTQQSEPTPRYTLGARYRLLPDQLGVDVNATRRFGNDPEGWGWNATMHYKILPKGLGLDLGATRIMSEPQGWGWNAGIRFETAFLN